MEVRIPSRPIHIALFLLLAFLCYQAHQVVRHLVGAGLCGGFGSMTFTVATTKQPCLLPTLVTLSGPALTYGLAWSGMLLLRSPKYALFAYALIFASFAHLRFIQTLTGRGDELVLAQHRGPGICVHKQRLEYTSSPRRAAEHAVAPDSLRWRFASG